MRTLGLVLFLLGLLMLLIGIPLSLIWLDDGVRIALSTLTVGIAVGFVGLVLYGHDLRMKS